MAAQQILYAETVAGMKKAFKRKAYDSDSDLEIASFTNRGHKLQKRARFAHKGQLAPTAGPSAYKKTVDYAGVRRNILYQNPPLVDDEGYEIVSDDDNDERVEDAELAAAELNPYSNIRLEHLLAPLTNPIDLPLHPTLSKPLVSKTLTELTEQSCDMMRKENRSLWQVRHLWTSLCGDGVWMPCETMIRPNDMDCFSDEHIARFLQIGSSNDGDGALGAARAMVNGHSHPPNARDTRGDHSQRPGDTSANRDASVTSMTYSSALNSNHDPKTSGQDSSGRWETGDAPAKPGEQKEAQHHVELPGGDTEAQLNAARMETDLERCPAVETPNSNGETFIHPMFLPPPGVKPDRDIGIPENEAEDIRRLLALYVQKQEEVCRGASRLHLGLLRAQRLRKSVLHWAKAEAHCGPNRDMSDGEDWYDKEEWGLLEDLKKGQEEEEEDTTTTGKKTRARRN